MFLIGFEATQPFAFFVGFHHLKGFERWKRLLHLQLPDEIVAADHLRPPNLDDDQHKGEEDEKREEEPQVVGRGLITAGGKQ